MRIPFRPICLCLTLIAGLNPNQWISAGEPTTEDRQTAQVVSALLEQVHISRQPLDDTISRRALDLYLQMLDPKKLFFYQSDVDQFQSYATQLDDLSRRGDVKPAFAIYEQFLVRMDQRVDVVQSLLDGPLDFTVDEKVVIDPESAHYANSKAESDNRWRREIKWQLLSLKAQQARESTQQATQSEQSDSNNDVSQDDVQEDPVESLKRRYLRIKKRAHQLTNDKLIERYLTAIASAYDPHTTYLSAGTMDQFMISMRLNLEGIGAELREIDDYTVITKLINGGAAKKGQVVKTDDKVLAVAQGTDGQWVNMVGVSVDEVASQIRGKSGSTVRLKLKSRSGEIKETSIVRSKVELSDRAATGKTLPFTTQAGETIKVGYVFLPSFYRDAEALQRGDKTFRSCSRDVRKILRGFHDQNVDAVVLDLRANGGGFLDEAVNVTGLFIDHGPVVQVKDFRSKIEIFRDEDKGVAWDGPLAVLTSAFSASASEIVAGAVKDYRRGLIIGDQKTHGKGSVQSPLDVAAQVNRNPNKQLNMGALKITIQQYFLPSGASTQIEGVTSGVILPSLASSLSTDESELKYALPHSTIAAVERQDYHQVSEEITSALQQSSSLRVANSDEFSEMIQRCNAFKHRQDQTHLSILESTFNAERLELETSADETLLDKTADDFPLDHYDREVLEIVQDYVHCLNGVRAELDAPERKITDRKTAKAG